MASLYRRERSKYWWYKIYVRDRPIQRSTRCVTKRDAQRYVALLEGEKAKGGPLHIRYDLITFDELARDLRTHYTTTGTRNLREVGYRLAHLDRFFAGRRAVSIDPPLVTEYVLQRQQEGASNRTVEIEIAVLKRMLGLAYRNAKLMRVPRFEKLKVAPPRSGFLEPKQFWTIHKHLPDYLKPPVRVAYITGWRVQSEVLSLRWSQVDFPGSVMRLEPGMGKTGEPRLFPLNDELRGILEIQRTRTEKLGRIIPWVFHRDGKQIKNIDKAWKSARKKAGLPWVIPHDMRRSAVRNMVRAGIPERTCMLLTGHKTRNVFDNYSICSEGDLREATKKLAEV